MIEVQSITKSFGDIKAVKNVTFTVNSGEVVGFLGPNGAGKSTTMRLMTGFFTPDSGDIKIDGISVLDSPTVVQEKIGYLPENNPLYKDMLVSDFLSFSGTAKGIQKSRMKELIEISVERAGISSVFYRPIGQLSKGFKQRVGLACTLLHMPKILILDEPQEGLDPNQRAEIRELITSLAKEHTVILSTHVLQEVETTCSRMIIMNKGVIVADGTVHELTKKGGAANLSAVLEGKGVEKELKDAFGSSLLSVTKNHNGKYHAEFSVKRTKIQPELSRLSKKHDWVIWKLSEEEENLEQIFQKLTENNI